MRRKIPGQMEWKPQSAYISSFYIIAYIGHYNMYE